MSDIYHVPPSSLRIDTNQPKRDIRAQMARLVSEGQIEPIPINPDLSLNRSHPDFWVYSDAQIMAAIVLNWDTILVAY